MSVRRSLTAIAVGITAVLIAGAPAGAHVSPSPGEVPAGGYSTVFFQVPHGCDGSPTTKVAIRIPEGVSAVKPEVVAGWTASTTTAALAQPITMHGKEITTRVSEVTWTGGPLADDQFQRFGISMKLPDDEVGTELAFPTVQTCVPGSTSWIEIPEEGKAEPDKPAPMLTLAKASGDGHRHGGGSMDHSEHNNVETVAWIGLGTAITGLVLSIIALIVAAQKKRVPPSA